MKNKLYIALLLLLGVAACSDENTVAELHPISDINIEKFETEYLRQAYIHQTLELTAQITSGYPESDLAIDWYLIDLQKQNLLKPGTSDRLEREHIASGKQLSYEVNLPPGEYTLICEVKAPNGYTKTQTTTLKVETEFSNGFYIMKETADGNTDLDLFLSNNGYYKFAADQPNTMHTDLLTSVLGKPMEGKPLALTIAYDHSYINSETKKRESANFICVSTQKGLFQGFRSTDLKGLLNMSSVFFSSSNRNDEHGIGILSSIYKLFLLTNKGVYGQDNSASLGVTSGLYGTAYVNDGMHPGNIYAAYSPSHYGVILWNEHTHGFDVYNYNGDYQPLVQAEDEPEVQTSGLTGYTCVKSGVNYLEEITYFLLKNAENSYKLYTITRIDNSFKISVKDIPATSCLAGATAYGNCEYKAAAMYAVKNNKIYTHALGEEDIEEEIVAEGIPAGETITYISNQVLGQNFDYLAIATQQGNTYKVYFYNILGGKPKGTPIAIATGTGIFKSMRYVKRNHHIHFNNPPAFID